MENQNSTTVIPNKRYFTIGEASKICDVKSHVLRYWEQEFKELDPIKRKGNRRYCCTCPIKPRRSQAYF